MVAVQAKRTIDQRVMYERLQHCHDRVVVVTKHAHDGLAAGAEIPLDTTHLEGALPFL